MRNQAARKAPAPWLHALKTAGPPFVFAHGDGAAPTLQHMWGSGRGLFKSQEPHQSIFERTKFQHNLTAVLNLAESQRASADVSSRWSCWLDNGESLQRLVSQ